MHGPGAFSALVEQGGPFSCQGGFYHLLQVLSTLEETTLQAGDRWMQPGSLLSYLVQELTEC